MPKRKKSKAKPKQRVYAKIVSEQMMLKWKLKAALLGIVLSMLQSWYYQELTMMKLDGIIDTSVTVVNVCADIGLVDCAKVIKHLRN